MKWMRGIVVALVAAAGLAGCQAHREAERPRVFVFTDVNIDAGDPDDRQSLVHLLWYADELQIEGIVPDRWNARGLEATQLALAAYATDFHAFGFGRRGFPEPETIDPRIARDRDAAIDLFARAARAPGPPLYVLVWGNMVNFGEALRRHPDVAGNLRVVSIGTGPMLEADMEHIPADWERSEPCVQLNWNGEGRNRIFHDPRFREMWWLEINWTYNGMFTGDEPRRMFDTLATYGAMGQHMRDVTENEPWARYFRVGDTPSVLYVIDPRHDHGDPTRGSWAGRFVRPLPDARPNYFADAPGPVAWDHADPCRTWDNHRAVFEHARSTLEQERPGMYEALLRKLDEVYGRR